MRGLIFLFAMGLSVVAQAYPQVDPSVRTLAECQQKAGDWDAAKSLCTIYVSDGSDNEGSENTGSDSTASRSAHAIYERGVNLLGDRSLLNPVVCELPKTGEIALIYSDDFRYLSDAYVLTHTGLTFVDRNKLNIKRENGPRKLEGSYEVESVSLNGATLKCVTSTMVLESVF